MTDCPVEVTDYESALVQADWYEEHGYQETAEQVRHRSSCFTRLPDTQWKKSSKCKSTHNHAISMCCSSGATTLKYHYTSHCQARKGPRNIFSTSNFKTRKVN
jgi:hypothetical protein